MKQGASPSKPVIEKRYLLPFILITSLFALWGFANDITNPLVAAFQTIMELPASEAALIQFAFYGGYGTMAIPAALFVRRYSYKKGILLGLALYAAGAFLFIPAAQFEQFSYFLLSLYILTFGLAFLETTANPYIISMGDEATSTRRLNFAQSFNPMGSLLGMFVASNYVLTSLSSEKRDAAGNLIFYTLSDAEKAVVRTHDLAIIRNPYVIIGGVVLLVFVVIALTKMPRTQSAEAKNIRTRDSARRLIRNSNYREGVIAQFFYVAAQIMCWTFIIQYAENIGIPKAVGQRWNILAMVLFLSSRFISTYLMKYLRPSLMLTLFAIGAMSTTLGVIFIGGTIGLYCLVATSIFMSLMFPTIYGIALKGLGDDSTLGAAGLVMAIVGGALMPPLQGAIIDLGRVAWLPAVNASFILPFICFLAVSLYGIRTNRRRITG
ncbi:MULTISPECIES: L-fucose:H+ symporter permease [Petrimonas]|jgi:FHS family L-fucose permease-like MFS transporter|uniref:L-fucose permease n=2 Tax=Petrimonas mucosa TaxID=1642646 RepID=A0A1G4GB31_9BACT|nr:MULTISPECIES: L-fucose:H+ symporter permease [Petrimonas]MDD3561223.1 L-fucose:H+ symporter permease [Petrimonas mucosa]SCM59760.1 L-fucose permease [Petrimonas mucosa]SFU42364.1 MFS transporter, FHS family, L-fucose permease [Porphyromonadaceae bacterium KHP3R9]